MAANLFLGLDCLQAASIELEQVIGVFLGFGSRSAALKADAGRTGAPITGGHRDKFHQIKGNIFVTTGTGCGAGFVYAFLRGRDISTVDLVVHWYNCTLICMSRTKLI